MTTLFSIIFTQNNSHFISIPVIQKNRKGCTTDWYILIIFPITDCSIQVQFTQVTLFTPNFNLQEELWPFYVTCLGGRDHVKNNFHCLHMFISRNMIITLNRDKTVTLIPMLTKGTLVSLINFITMITVLTPTANLLAVQSKQSLLSFFMLYDIKWNRYTYTGCFTTCGHYCRRWFPKSLWSKKFI